LRKTPKKGAARPPRKQTPTDNAGSIASPLENLIGYRLRLAYNVQVQRFASVAGEANIRPQQFAALKLAYFSPGLKQQDLTNTLNKKHANIVTLLDELEDLGLMTRVADTADRRSRILNLTSKGKKLTKRLIERYELLDRDLDKALGVQNRRKLVELLDAFRLLDPEPDIDKHA
jgi:DNA-binding MarR family transcriptional regulator